MVRRLLSIDEADGPCGQMSHLYNLEVGRRSQVAFCRVEILDIHNDQLLMWTLPLKVRDHDAPANAYRCNVLANQ